MHIKTPVLFDEDIDTIMNHKGLSAKRVAARYQGGGAAGALDAGVKALCAAAEAAVKGGSQCVVISDRPEFGDAKMPAIDSLLAVGEARSYQCHPPRHLGRLIMLTILMYHCTVIPNHQMTQMTQMTQMSRGG